MPGEIDESPADDDGVEHEIDGDDRHRESDGLAESLEEDRAECRQQHQRQRDRVVHPAGHERILDDVRGRVRRRERDGDDESGRGETQQDQHQQFAAPARQQLLEDRDAALSVRAEHRHAVVHRERAEEREQDQNEGGERRDDSGGKKCDARLVAERREVVHARQAHHLPPRLTGGRRRAPSVAFRLPNPFEEPDLEPPTLPGS